MRRLLARARGSAFAPVAAALAVGAAVRVFLGAPVRAEGFSMEPGVAHRQWCLVERASRWLGRRPSLGEVLSVRAPDGSLVLKRVVGLEGDVVEVREGLLLREGAPVPARSLGRAAHAPRGAGILPLRALVVERFEETLGGTHLVQRYLRSESAPARRVGPGELYLLGDNRDDSRDSRAWGPLALARVDGRAWCP